MYLTTETLDEKFPGSSIFGKPTARTLKIILLPRIVPLLGILRLLVTENSESHVTSSNAFISIRNIQKQGHRRGWIWA